MSEQVAFEKNRTGRSPEELYSVARPSSKQVQQAIDFLSEDYAAAVKIASNLGSHSRWIPYPFLSNYLKRIAEEMRAQAELFRTTIVDLGGQPPQAEVGEREVLDFHENVKRLVKDVEEHAARDEELVHQRNKTTLGTVANVLDAIILDMERQKDELIDIVMRLS